MEIRPAIFGGTDVMADDEDDIFGVLTTATFKFSSSFTKIVEKHPMWVFFLTFKSLIYQQFSPSPMGTQTLDSFASSANSCALASNL